jgi:uncharacterized protein YbdZ (MbtH family)
MPTENTYVLVNYEEQCSLWPLDKSLPTGWQQSDASGDRETHLAYCKRDLH